MGEEKDLIDAMLKAVRAAMLNGGLPGNLDVQSFVDAIVLIWQGLSYSRMADDFDMDRLARAARELIQGRLAMAKEAND